MSTSESESLIGQREDQRREFKAADALGKPATIGREAVAFLNAEGGEVWIGVEDGGGIATAVHGVPNPHAARDALWNHLVDTIEPPPRNDEIRAEVVAKDGHDVIRVTITHRARKPYALRSSRCLQFPIRIGDRIREMEREEIADAFRHTEAPEAKVEGKKAELGRAVEKVRGSTTFWWRLCPTESLDIDFEHADAEMRRFLEGVLMDPAMSNNRRMGWTMVFDETQPEFKTDRLIHRFGRAPAHEVEILPDGTMTFVAPRRRLDRNWDEKGTEIFPLALIELPVSGFRMAAQILKRYAQNIAGLKIVAAAIIGGMAHAKLRAGSPQDPFLRMGNPEHAFEGRDLIVPPFEIDANEFQNPDAAAYRLVRRIYEEFGFSDEEAIPREFDRKKRVLSFR